MVAYDLQIGCLEAVEEDSLKEDNLVEGDSLEEDNLVEEGNLEEDSLVEEGNLEEDIPVEGGNPIGEGNLKVLANLQGRILVRIELIQHFFLCEHS